MKYTILGIKDYCKDTWHDWLARRVYKIGCEMYDPCGDTAVPAMPWKEGNVWHYIRQRKVGRKIASNEIQAT